MKRNRVIGFGVVLGGLISALVATGFEVIQVERSENGFTLTWNAVPGKEYQVEWLDALDEGVIATETVMATSTLMRWEDVVDFDDLDTEQQFYRIRASDTNWHKVTLGDVRTWCYNIQHVQDNFDLLLGTHFDMYVLEPVITDPEETSVTAQDMIDLIEGIRDYNKKHYFKDPIVLAYIDMGQAEDWRWYWKDGWEIGNPEWVLGEDPNEWEGNFPVAFWTNTWSNIVIYGHEGMSHVGVTLQLGFDGIYMDWVEAFSHDDVVNFADDRDIDTAEAMFDFIAGIRTHARRTNPNYLVIAQNASDLYQYDTNRYAEIIDGIALEAIWLDGFNPDSFTNWNLAGGYNQWTTNGPDPGYSNYTEEVLEFLAPMKERGIPIFCCEYAQDVDGSNMATHVYRELAPGYGFIPYCTRRSLGTLSTTPYPPDYRPHDY